MIRLTRQADIGIVLMTALARYAGEEPRTSRELAAETRLSLPIVSKVLKLLARAKLLRSTRGQRGGYVLGQSADEISIADMITALEGPIALTVCFESTGSCDHEASCPVHGNWMVINRVVHDALDRISLRQMSEPSNPDLLGRKAEVEDVARS